MTRTRAIALFALVVLALGSGFLGGRASLSGDLDSTRSELASAQKSKDATQIAKTEVEGRLGSAEQALGYVYEAAESMRMNCLEDIAEVRSGYNRNRCDRIEDYMSQASETIGRGPWVLVENR